MKPFRERNPVIVGAASIIVLALLMLAAFRAQDLPLIGGGKVYYADFTESGGLKAGDEVRIAGVRVGQVDDVTLEDGMAKAAFRVKTDSPFGDETGAAILVKTLLGQMYLSLEPAGSGQLDSGTTIPADRTSSPYDVVKAFSGLAATASNIDTDQLAKSMTVLASLTRNTPVEFREALRGVSRLSETISSRSDQLGSLLTNLRRVSTTLSDRSDDIVGLMKSSNTLFQALVVRRAAIHRILVATSKLSVQLTGLVADSKADLNPALQHLGNVLDVLNKNEDNIDNSLRLLAPFYRVFANTLGNGPWFDTFIFNLPPVPSLTNGGVSP